METVVYLIRHSEVTPKANIKAISVHDNDQVHNEKGFLSVKGEKKAELLSKNKELQNIDAVYSSNYVRTLATAKYIALENNMVIHVDDRLDERKIGQIGKMTQTEFERLQRNDFDFKLPGGESLNQTKKRMADAVKNILMFETEKRIVVLSHATAITALLTSWCEIGYNYDENIILTYGDETIIDGSYTAPMVFKITFDGMNVTSIKYLDII